uniref:Uncharacterized protein n=1 Tax=Picea glauca TaxID=3330 RepID=A0A124GNN2_PICGL|nr:hypothetical protein ABT39_MTgene3876 [Picea glauca]
MYGNQHLWSCVCWNSSHLFPRRRIDLVNSYRIDRFFSQFFDSEITYIIAAALSTLSQ